VDFADGLVFFTVAGRAGSGLARNYGVKRWHGDVTYFNVNRHINPTNVCVANAKLCAFGRKRATRPATRWRSKEAWTAAASGYSEAVTSSTSLAACTPIWPFEYFLDLGQRPQQRFPKVHVKAFTMVEVAFFAAAPSSPLKRRSQDARGRVDSMPVAAREIFAERVRSIICDHKDRR